MYKGLLQQLQPDFQRNIPIFLIIWVSVVAADLLVYSVYPFPDPLHVNYSVLRIMRILQFMIFNPLSYCFKETIRFDVKVLFAGRPVSRLIRWHNKPVDITKEFWKKGLFNSMRLFMDWKLQTVYMKCHVSY